MGGDHKCLVCGSTFTRPQHVARHMRSHTGDRPYKCTHCGDQFARSDLLSRHVNKCHAAEKPPTTTQPARRKGHAQPGSSSSGGVRGPPPSLAAAPGDISMGLGRRICDACAVSRTPAQCDAGVPCGKCLQRNTKCTYVKSTDVSRRTVSVPSIPPIPSSITTIPGSGPSSISLARTHHHQPQHRHPHSQSQPPQHQLQHQHQHQLSHDLFTAPPTVPSMTGPRTGVDAGATIGIDASTLMGVDTTLFVPQAQVQQQQQQQQPAFNFTVPLYPQALDLRAGDSIQSTHNAAFTDHTHAQPPPHISSYVEANPSKGLDTFLAGPYSASPVTATDFLYDAGVELMGVQGQQQRQEGGQDKHGQHHQHQGQQHQQQMQQQPDSMHTFNFSPTGVFQFGAHQQTQPQLHSQSQSQSQSQVGDEFAFGSLGTHTQPFAQGTLAEARGGVLVDAGAPSNRVHDPVTTTTSNTSTAASLLAPPEGGVSNAFGLMSLDDPIVAAEMNKGGSFFAPGALPGGGGGGDNGLGLGMFGMGGVGMQGLGVGGGMGMTTGMLTPGRDANIAELKDFWKAFMRTPGEKTPPGGAMINGDGSQGGQNQGGRGAQSGHTHRELQGGQDSYVQRRSLSKIASLPDIKTPPVHALGGGMGVAGGGGTYGAAQAQGVYNGIGVGGQVHADGSGVGRANGREDLRSYEMAVMARPAPTRLTLPRKRATFPREGQSQTQHQQQQQQQQQHHRHLSPRVSSSSTSSSPSMSAAAAGGATGGASPSASVASGVSAGSGGEGGDGGSGPGSVGSQSVSGGGSGGGADGSGGEGSGGSAAHSPLLTTRAHTHPIPQARGHAPANVHSRPHDVRHGMNAQARERPSFKRLASQTLGPFESKSVKVSHRNGGGDVGLERLEAGSGVEGGERRMGEGGGRDAGGNKTNVKVDNANSTAHSHANATAHGEYEYAQGQAYAQNQGHEFYHQHQQHRRLSAPSQSATRPTFTAV